MMKFLQKKIQFTFALLCLLISNQIIAQTNLLTVSPSFESGSGVGAGSSLDGGSWARTGDASASSYILRQGLGNTVGAPVAFSGNYYLEATTPNNATFNTHTKLVAGNSQNLINLGKGKTYRVFFHYQNSTGHSFRALVLTSNASILNEVVISNEATGWTEGSFDFLISASSTSTSASLRFEFGLNAGTTRIDNVRIYDLATLPVDLKSFNLTKVSNAVQLTWESLSEENNSHYEIFRSTNGIEFSKLEVIKAKNKPSMYSFEDKNPNEGVNYYKLIQYDFDGTAKELALKAINYKISDIKLSIYPNPFVDEIILDDNSSEANQVLISIFNMTGQIIKSQKFNSVLGYNNYRIQTRDLPTGMYTLIYESAGLKKAYKIKK